MVNNSDNIASSVSVTSLVLHRTGLTHSLLQINKTASYEYNLRSDMLSFFFNSLFKSLMSCNHQVLKALVVFDIIVLVGNALQLLRSVNLCVCC